MEPSDDPSGTARSGRRVPAPSKWVFPPATEADEEGVVAVGGDLLAGTLLDAYAAGMFPMPIRRGRLAWFSPDPRAVLPVEGVHVSRSLRRSMRAFEVSVDQCFEQVMRRCGDPRRPHGWINDDIVAAYTELHRLGWAHSVEIWHEGSLAGGLYGVSVGGLFAGESMFHSVTDASKAAVVATCQILAEVPGAVFDVQWQTPHLESLGVIEIDRDDYLDRVAAALEVAPPAVFDGAPSGAADLDGQIESDAGQRP